MRAQRRRARALAARAQPLGGGAAVGQQLGRDARRAELAVARLDVPVGAQRHHLLEGGAAAAARRAVGRRRDVVADGAERLVVAQRARRRDQRPLRAEQVVRRRRLAARRRRALGALDVVEQRDEQRRRRAAVLPEARRRQRRRRAGLDERLDRVLARAGDHAAHRVRRWERLFGEREPREDGARVQPRLVLVVGGLGGGGGAEEHAEVGVAAVGVAHRDERATQRAAWVSGPRSAQPGVERTAQPSTRSCEAISGEPSAREMRRELEAQLGRSDDDDDATRVATLAAR